MYAPESDNCVGYLTNSNFKSTVYFNFLNSILLGKYVFLSKFIFIISFSSVIYS